MFTEGNSLLVRLFNATAEETPHQVRFDFIPGKIELVDLNGQVTTRLAPTKAKDGWSDVHFGIPRFGIRTLRFTMAKPERVPNQ